MGHDTTAEKGGHFTLPHVRDHWYPLCTTRDLGSKPIRRALFGSPLVLFRAAGGLPAALLDRCAHRNVPLSGGQVVAGRIECAYHGWQFGRDGGCGLVPALTGHSASKARTVPSHAARESQGYVWVYGRADVEPSVEPYSIPFLDDQRYGVVRYRYSFDASLHAVAENVLDVPHTAFLHRGLFRGGTKRRITAVVRPSDDRVEAEFLGEPRPSGVAARLLAPGGGELSHFDRFILPSVAQVEYGLGFRSHLVLTSILVPEEDFVTRMEAVATFRLPMVQGMVKRLMMPIAKRILDQDAAMLKKQTEAVQAFGGERYASTDVDLLGPHILRLLRRAERGESPPEGALEEKRIELMA